MGNPYNTEAANETSLAAEVQLLTVLFVSLVLPFIEHEAMEDGFEAVLGTALVVLFIIVMGIAFYSTFKEMLHDVIFDDSEEIKEIKRKARSGRRLLSVSSLSPQEQSKTKSAIRGNKIVPVLAAKIGEADLSIESDDELKKEDPEDPEVSSKMMIQPLSISPEVQRRSKKQKNSLHAVGLPKCAKPEDSVEVIAIKNAMQVNDLP